MLSVSELPTHESPDTTPDDLYEVAEDLMLRSKAARGAGDTASAQRLLRAALDLMGAEVGAQPTVAPRSPVTAQVTALLKTGWHEPAQLVEATGLSPGSVRATLAHLKRRGVDLQVEHITRYRIGEKD